MANKFITLKDRLLTTTSATASLAALGAGFGVLFNPVALGAAAGVVAYNLVASIPALTRASIKSAVKKGNWQPVAEDEMVAKVTEKVSQDMGRPEAPKLYTVDDKTVAKFALPFGLRWMLKVPEMRDEAMKGLYAALPGTNTIITTPDALNNGLTEDQMRFVAAHEISHLDAKDNRSPSLKMRTAVKKSTRVLFWGTLAAIGASVAGVTLPIVAAGAGVVNGLVALGGLAGTYLAARTLNNVGLRRVERRADRNALKHTRDLDNAVSALHDIDSTADKKFSIVAEMVMLDHASWPRRVKSLKKDFDAETKRLEAQAPAKKPAPTRAPVPTV